MFEQENIIDLVIWAQYVVSNSQNLDEVTVQLTKLKPLLNVDGLTVELLLKLLVVSLPALLCKGEIVNCVESVIELEKDDTIIASEEDRHLDVAAMFGDQVEVPAALSGFFALPLGQKKILTARLYESVNTEAYKYNFILKSKGEMITSAELFQVCIKSFIFRANYEFNSFSYTNNIITTIKGSKYANLELLDWIKGFYTPLSELSVSVGYSYSLLDYDIILSVEERVDLIMSPLEKQKIECNVIDEVLVPHIRYIGIDAWNCLNSWLLNFGLKCVSETDHLKLITNYKLLLNILRHENLLLALDTVDYTIKATFTCTILATIYLCPKAVLQVFVYSKEMLTLLKSLTLENGSDSFNAEKLFGLTLSEVVEALSATYKTIDSILSVINVGEVLYSNELSFVQIMALENSDKSAQYSELIKFIDNEVTYETSNKKWSLFLNSLFSTLKKTSIFNKISVEELSEIILLKLLNLRQFSVIKNVYQVNFDYLPKSHYEKLMVKHCWQLYMKARNCDQKIGSLKDCVDCLEFLEPNLEDVRRLSSLIEANSKLLDWKFYLKPGVPITPKDIFEVADPLIVIRRILELNENAYMYPGDLYYLLTLLIDGMHLANKNKLYEDKNKSYDDPSNLLVVKLKLLCLEFSSAVDYSYSFDLGSELLMFAIKEKYEIDHLFELVSENWFLFFQLSKNEYEDESEYSVINNKLKLLGKLLLVAPTEFNTIVLEQWQMLNSQNEQMATNNEIDRTGQYVSSNLTETSLGDVQARLQRSLKSSAQELLNTDGSEIGKNIIGWIVGAN